MKKDLTVVITTFNRKNRLLVQLKSLLKQPLSKNINIVISDNCSDYDIDKTLESNFSQEMLSNVEVVRRPFNIGMIGNISGAFSMSNTKWMWLLSDDDETSIDSISTIFKYINLFPEIMAFKFTEIGLPVKTKYEVTNVSSVRDLLEFCSKSGVDLGNFIFMSNNVYNMEALYPHLGSASVYSYTYFPHMIPILVGLNQGGELKFIPEQIVSYQIPEVPAASNYLVSIYLGAMSIADIPFKLSAIDYRNLREFFRMNVFWEISNDFYNSSYLQKRYLYRKIYKSVFGVSWSFKNIIIYRLFDFQMFIGSNAASNFCFKLKETVRKVL